MSHVGTGPSGGADPLPCGTLLVMSPLLLTPAAPVVPVLAAADVAGDDRWTTADWALGVVLPLILLGAGVALLLRGRAALAEATRVRAGFGGPPGSLDVGTELGFGVEHDRGRVLAAQRLRLWGLVLVAVAVVWLLVTLVVALL